LKKTADESAARVIEMELKRGDSATEVSALALEIGWCLFRPKPAGNRIPA
jgi:hypothetical protein